MSLYNGVLLYTLETIKFLNLDLLNILDLPAFCIDDVFVANHTTIPTFTVRIHFNKGLY